LGGKGYKPRKDYAGRRVSGDWEDSDRGAGNRATRRAGGNVKAKSPTYIAHVINKGKKKVNPEKNPAVKEHHQTDANGKVIEHGDGTPSSVEEDFIGEVNVENSNPNSNEKKIDVMKGKNKIKINPNVGEQVQHNNDEKEDPSLKQKEKQANMLKKRVLMQKLKAVRGGAGESIMASHQLKGEQEQEDPRSMGTKYRNIKNRLRSMGVKFVGPASRLEEEDKAFNYVLAKLKKKHGSGVLTKGDKIKPQSAADKAKVRAHQAKVDAENAAERKKDPSQGRYSRGY